MPIERIQPPGLKCLPLFTHVVKAANTVYLAGQVALDANGQLVGRGDVARQAEQIFQNITTALSVVNGNLSNVVRLTVYTTEAEYLQPIAAVRARFFGSPDPIASTFVVVRGFALPDLLVEIEATAVLDS